MESDKNKKDLSPELINRSKNNSDGVHNNSECNHADKLQKAQDTTIDLIKAYEQECTHAVDNISQNDLNTSKCSNQKQTPINVCKVDNVEDDINSGKFSDQCDYTKRSKLQNLMKEEVFDSPTHPIYQQNKTGFCTKRPLEWLQAIEKYIACDENVYARWTYKQDTNGKFYEGDIVIYFQTTTEITIQIYIVE